MRKAETQHYIAALHGHELHAYAVQRAGSLTPTLELLGQGDPYFLVQAGHSHLRNIVGQANKTRIREAQARL